MTLKKSKVCGSKREVDISEKVKKRLVEHNILRDDNPIGVHGDGDTNNPYDELSSLGIHIGMSEGRVYVVRWKIDWGNTCNQTHEGEYSKGEYHREQRTMFGCLES